MLKTLEIVHIGDVHFPESKDERLADIRDSGFPPGVAERAKLTPLRCVARKYTAVVDKQPDVLLFSGDLTSFGDAQGYRDCLTFLNQLFNLKRLPQKRLHAVPGNHDVDRLNVDPSGKDLRRKFETFVLAWEDLGIPILAVDAVRKSSVSIPKAGASGVTLFSLNSSLGCGEMRYPLEIQNKLSDLLSDYAKSVGEKDAFPLVGEILDTPAFDQDHIEEVCHTIGGMNKKNVPVVVAHHNILPQASPRVAAYTELGRVHTKVVFSDIF
jgi:hypothetical protein